ncbi:MAG: aspartate carbamoyltransferase regulatory subunit [Bacteroidaceae bacterium]|jgi:aspartate carbamoyltransferase regulatory subunit|nr:aspartate carbamoyltransferase regulatory subunit [Bacteroidaceae bacterium]
MNKKQLLVAAIENGTVIDHIPAEKLFAVVNLLHLEQITSAVTIGYNLQSQELGTKSIIKIADKFFTDEELNQLAVVCPNLTLCIIRDYEIVEKRTVTLPNELFGIVKCANPKCITNNEPMRTHFHVHGPQRNALKCHYCNNIISLDDVQLVNK